jgi:hypothetical protein
MPFTTGSFTIHTNTGTDIYNGFSDRTWNGISVDDNICYAKPAGPFQLSTATATVYAALYDNFQHFIRMFKSTDSGATWAEADSANHPATINLGTTPTQERWGANYSFMGVSTNTATSIYIGTDTTIRVSLFDMSNGTWGSTFTGGPTVSQSPVVAPADVSVYLAASQRSNSNLIVSYSATPEVISLTTFGRIGIYKLVGTAWTNLTGTLIGAGNSQHYLPFENLNCQSDRTHVFYESFDPSSTLAKLLQTPVSSGDVVGTGQTLATHTGTLGGYVVYPSTFRSSDNTLTIFYRDLKATSTGTSTAGELWTAEGTDADSPTWTLTDQTFNSATYFEPQGVTQLFLLTGGLDGSGNPYVFFYDPKQSPKTIAEFNKVGGTWNNDDANVFQMDGLDDISARILADGTTWGIIVGGKSPNDGAFYLTWNPGSPPAAVTGFVFNPLNITY